MSDQKFKEEYQRNKGMVMGYILKNRPDFREAEALEVYQETWLRYLNIIEKPDFVLSTQLSTFLISIAKNILREGNRDIQTSDWDDKLNELFQEEDTLSQKKNDEENFQKLESIMQTITAKCKDIIQMFYFEGLSHQEIMEKMNYSSREVSRNTLNRCLDTMKNDFFKP
jgi:RNA polymerase sigma factor (sigma-70 family)